MYQITKRELIIEQEKDMRVVPCNNEEKCKEVKKTLKENGNNARCCKIRNKEGIMIYFVITNYKGKGVYNEN